MNENDEVVIIFGILIVLVLGSLHFIAIKNTAEYIGVSSSMRLMTCPAYFTDVQCIGKEKAQIISNLHKDGRDTHGILINYNNKIDVNNTNPHILWDGLYTQ